MQDSYCKRFEDDLEKIVVSISKKYSDKSYGKIMQRIGRIKERYSSIGSFYQINVHEEEDIVKSIEYHKVKAEEEESRFSGSYWFRNSYKGWDEKQICDTYMMPNRIESAFCSLKHELAFRPIYHITGNRADAHIFIGCWLIIYSML